MGGKRAGLYVPPAVDAEQDGDREADENGSQHDEQDGQLLSMRVEAPEDENNQADLSTFLGEESGDEVTQAPKHPEVHTANEISRWVCSKNSQIHMSQLLFDKKKEHGQIWRLDSLLATKYFENMIANNYEKGRSM